MRLYKLFAIFILLFGSTSLHASEHIVKLLTTDSKGGTMVFEPGFLKVSVGDTVIFEPADASHNAESFFSPSPDADFFTELGKIASVTMSHEGVYLYKCTPHFVLGMVGVIQVGKAINKKRALAAWDANKSALVMNQNRMDAYLDQID